MDGLPQCIAPNPDISGIGIRVAIYMQAILSLIQPLVAGYDGQLEAFEMESASMAYVGILLPGCALIISTIIQAKTFGLSVYHGLIVLNLSLINNMSSLTFFLLEMGDLLYGRGVQSWLWKMLKERQEGLVERWRKLGDVNQGKELDRGIKEILDEARDVEIEELKLMERMGAWFDKEYMTKDVEDWRQWRRQREVEGMLLGMNLDETQKERIGFEMLARASVALKEEGEQSVALEEKVNPWTSAKSASSSVSESQEKPKSVLKTKLPKATKIMTLCCSIHLILVSCFGLWLWTNVHTFGSASECTPYTHLVVFNRAIPVTTPSLRRGSIALYAFSIPPILNVYYWASFLSYIPSLPVFVVLQLQGKKNPFLLFSLPKTTAPENPGYYRTSSRIFFISSVVATGAAQLYLIITTELTIKNNRHLLKASVDGDAVSEGDWTFGQTLALTLTVMPMIEVIKFLWEKLKHEREEGKQQGK